MSCQIIRYPTTGKIKEVLAENGKPSILYSSLKKIIPSSIEPDIYVNNAFKKGFIKDFSKEEVALALWSKVYTPEFKEWFGKSKIVDSNGEPLLVYHSSSNRFSKFRNKSVSIDKTSGKKIYLSRENGIFFTPDLDYSVGYGNILYPSYLSIISPKTLDENSFTFNAISDEILSSNDGAYFEYYDDGKEIEIIAFKGNQVKSAFNHGTFMLETGNIYYQLSNEEVNQANPNLDKLLTQYLKDLGVDVKLVDNIKDSEGNIVNAYGKADLANQVIELLNDKRNVDTLAEEAAHMITAMLGKNHPIVKQMMNKIQDYEVYNEVKLQYNEVYKGNEESLRFEAVGKLIAKHIINKAPLDKEKRTVVEDWFNRLLAVLKRLVSPLNFTRVKNEIDIFEKMAQDILDRKFNPSTIPGFGSEQYQLKTLRDIAISYNINQSGFLPNTVNPDAILQDLGKSGITSIKVAKSSTGSYYFTRNNKKVNPLQSYYQLQQSKSQEEIVNSLIDTGKLISIDKVKLEDGNERYKKVTGEVIPGRVTDIQKELFEKNKTKEQISNFENSPKSIISKNTGTKLHDLYDNSIKFLISNRYDNLKGIDTVSDYPKKPDIINDVHFTNLLKSAKSLTDHISNTQRDIDPTKQAIVLTEAVVLGEINNKETAGTMDVIVVYSDGSVSIYDHKFINFKRELIDGKLIVDETSTVPFIKQKSYSLQLGSYKKILREKYGISNFRESRILPNNVQFRYKNKNITPEVQTLETFTFDKEYLMPIPVAKELTNNDKLNKILETLFKQDDVIEGLIKNNYSDKERLNSLNLQKNILGKAIQAIQVKSDINPLLDSINNILKNENKILDAATSLKDASDLNRMLEEVTAFDSLFHNIIDSVKDSETKDKVYKLFGNLRFLKDKIEEKRNELLINHNPDINNPNIELGWFDSTMNFLSQINHPIFETAREYIKKSFGHINKDVTVIIEQAKEKRNSLKQWADSKGISLLDAYRKIINPETGNLIFTFSGDFYNKKAKAIEEEDLQWMQDNYYITEEGKSQYEADLKSAISAIELTTPEGRIREIQIEKWKNKNDLSRKSAWFNKWTLNRYTEVKNPSKWYSTEYKDLLQDSNKPLKEYFDWYVETNKLFNSLVPEKINRNFVANIQKDVIDSISQGGGIIESSKDGWKNVVDSLRVRQNDITGLEDDNNIPLLYYDSFMFKDENGNWTVDSRKKNEDLTNNIILFSESVFRKHHMSKITDIMDLLKSHLSEQKVIKTDNFGKPVKNKEGTGWEMVDSEKNTQVFDKLIKGLVYGQTLQSKDKHFEVFGKVVSGNKTIKGIMSYLSVKALSLNYVSSFGNLAGGYLNTYIKGVGGRYYNTSQMKKAHSLLINRSDRDLYNHLTSYFNIENENWIKKEAAKLSTSALTKNLTYDKWYILQQKGDEMIGNTILISMMQNYGIDENGKVRRLATLPEGSKSLFDKVNRDNDKISIEGLTDEQFTDFRNMVKYVSRQIKGTNTREDISVMQTNLWGQTLLQFRSWFAPMVKERYGSLKYTKEVQEFEYGRYNSLFKSLSKEKLVNNISKIMLDIISLGRIKYQADTELLMKQYNEFLSNNPNLQGKLSVEEYLDLRERTIKEAMMEARIIAGMLVLLGAMGGDWDDDGKADYKKWFVTRQVYKLIERTYLELSFFTNPLSFNQLIKNPIPIVSVGSDIVNLGTNTVDEFIDTITFTSQEDEKTDKTPKLKYTSKMISGVRFIDQLFQDYMKDDEDKKD